MSQWIVRVIANACALAVAAWLFTGIAFNSHTQGKRFLTLLVVALIFGLVNEFVRPIVSFFSIPLYLLTLGLFFFVVNALMLWLTSWFSGVVGLNFHVHGFWTAVFGAIVISIVSWAVGFALPGDSHHSSRGRWVYQRG
jgi:putative membrane protein